ncbi:MAG: hypothetical protein QHH80_08465 [Anaerolineae bacterium]|nr:hypothetical protein [Anaerolineae bacterium]
MRKRLPILLSLLLTLEDLQTRLVHLEALVAQMAQKGAGGGR